MIPLIIVCALASAICYRAGGMAKDVIHWIPVSMRQRWVRAWICPLFAYLPVFIFKITWSWQGIGLSLLAYGLLGGALTTYWDWL